MCGIFGAYSQSGISPIEGQLRLALNEIQHRGPDSSGQWIAANGNLFFGHRRLAIIDLSPAGHQPMSSYTGRYTITFNGEIYNFQILKRELEAIGQTLTAGGDTAVMLAAFEAWGVATAVSKFVGMFAFAVWDEELQELTLARDRSGEKPLYYGWKDGRFLFASELSPIIKSVESKFRISATALGHLVKFAYVPAPLSIFETIFKLPAASTLTLKLNYLISRPEKFDGYLDGNGIRPQRYWDLSNFLLTDTPVVKSESEYLSELESLLKQSIGEQMISDVPLGAFLSGGIDSSTVVAIMQLLSKTPVRTFSIGFDQKSHDEAPFAKAIAKHLGTDHTELYVSEQDALNVIPSLPDIYSEPFGDSSQIPTYLVSKLCRQKVTVSLSGDGGDEVFGGYQRYLWTKKLWNIKRWSPSFLDSTASALANAIPTAFLDRAAQFSNQFLPNSLKLKNAGAKIQRALSIGATPSPEDLYLIFLSQKCDPKHIVPDFIPSKTALASIFNWPDARDLYTRLMWMDHETYLPDDIFVKVDRASMSVALESRAPFLDHRLVEFAFGLPTEMKIRGSETKYILRKLLEKYVPLSLTERPKMGFAIPVGDWIAGQLKDWAENLLSESALAESGMFNTAAIIKVWKSHLAGNKSSQYFLWHVLMFQAWYQRHKAYITH